MYTCIYVYPTSVLLCHYPYNCMYVYPYIPIYIRLYPYAYITIYVLTNIYIHIHICLRVGWDEGFMGMKIGEKAILRCRSDYAYGKRGSPPGTLCV